MLEDIDTKVENISYSNLYIIDNRARHQAMGGTAGPHNTNVANKVDPRVDSDLGPYLSITPGMDSHPLTH